MKLLESMAVNDNRTRTQNGAGAFRTTLNRNLDFFSLGGALRARPEEFVVMFREAFNEDRLTALRTLFYLRDIRGGQGERSLFRAGLLALRAYDYASYTANLQNVSEYGRWDDLWAFKLDPAVGKLIDTQWASDFEGMHAGKPISLMAKWLPSENASSKRTVQVAREIIKFLGISPKEYRKAVVAMRKHIALLEHKMSANQWDEINYEMVPSQAHRKHTKAFSRNDARRYAEYLESVVKGEKKINTSTLFTYEVYDMVHAGQTSAADALWANLSDYTNGGNALVVADVSGSMTGRPMSVSVSLALYFAERNTGPFNGYFMTFSAIPQLVKVQGNTLTEKMWSIETAQWSMNTNISAMFDKILEAATTNGCSQDDLPKTLYIISDMEFDEGVSASETVFEEASRKFDAAGLTLPTVVFWNVRSGGHVPATKFDNNVTLISGSSQSAFQYAVEGKSPMESMLDILNGDRYNKIVVA